MKNKLLRSVFGMALVLCISTGAKAQESYLGDVKLVAFNFQQRGWMECDGRLLPISQNTALFSLLGTMYGGDGRTTFALPDLRGRVPVGVGNGPGLNPVKQGEKTGGQQIAGGEKEDPNTGTQTPTLGLRYLICVQGMFPSRN